ncbi:hypothetical protein ACFOEK_10790 [Litoribrevibacter euphylliae]|uniref:Uncharacterized protein n=1 Tax=Litoribrevibacter euphylliae TaxID=1834034 RepID=A0ABV7HFX0_9GAMM
MQDMTHEITRGIKAGLQVRIVKDGPWIVVADVDGIEHKVRKKQLTELPPQAKDSGVTDEEIHMPTAASTVRDVDTETDPLVYQHPDPSDVASGSRDTTTAMSGIDHDPADDSDVERELEEADEQPMSMSNAFQERRELYKATDGCGDELQLALKGSTPAEVAQLAAILLGLPQLELVKKYAHLNAGQVRMNSGNRIRRLVKKGSITVEDVARTQRESEFYDEDEIEALFNEGL